MLFRLIYTMCISVLIIISVSFPTILQAGTSNIGNKILGNLFDAGKTGGGFLGPMSVEFIIGNIIKALLLLTGSVFLGLAVYGGLRWMNARGNPEEAKTARDILIDATIGLVIVLGAWALTDYILYYALVATGLPPAPAS